MSADHPNNRQRAIHLIIFISLVGVCGLLVSRSIVSESTSTPPESPRVLPTPLPEVRRFAAKAETKPDDHEYERLATKLRLAEFACAVKKRAWGCTDIVPFPTDPSVQPETVRGVAEEVLQDCLAKEQARVYLDCSEFPCLIISSGPEELTVDDFSCTGRLDIGASRRVAIGHEPAYTAVAVTPSAIWNAGNLDGELSTRMTHRAQRAYKVLQTQDEPFQYLPPTTTVNLPITTTPKTPMSVEDLRSKVAKAEAECSASMREMDCVQPLLFPSEENQGRHQARSALVDYELSGARPSEIKDIIEDAEDSCPGFGDTLHSLDCSEFPCILYTHYTRDAIRPKIFSMANIICNTELVHPISGLKSDGVGGLISYLPMFPPTWDASSEIQERISERLDIRLRDGVQAMRDVIAERESTRSE